MHFHKFICNAHGAIKKVDTDGAVNEKLIIRILEAQFRLMKTIFLVLFFLSFSITTTSQQLVCSAADSTLAATKIKMLHHRIQDGATFTETVVTAAHSFLGTPYVAQTLEINAKEPLVLNLQGLDCTTFVENVLALSATAFDVSPTLSIFQKNLNTIRYKNGVRDGYASRLHYFTAWIRDNVKKGFVHDITETLGGITLQKSIDFMSTHRNLYPMLKNNEEAFNTILTVENELNQETSFCYIPKAAIPAIEHQLQSGDIIALVTSINGLDVTHTGFIHKTETGATHLLHASTSGSVVLSQQPLTDYLAQQNKTIGILACRPIQHKAL